MTFAIVIGKYGGFYFNASKRAVRLCLGWIAFDWINAEYTTIVVAQGRRIRQLEAELEEESE